MQEESPLTTLYKPYKSSRGKERTLFWRSGDDVVEELFFSTTSLGASGCSISFADVLFSDSK
jgi:hypothetical protein